MIGVALISIASLFLLAGCGEDTGDSGKRPDDGGGKKPDNNKPDKCEGSGPRLAWTADDGLPPGDKALGVLGMGVALDEEGNVYAIGDVFLEEIPSRTGGSIGKNQSLLPSV